MAQSELEETKNPVISSPTTAGQLSCDQQMKIDQHYRKHLPAYGGIRKQYEEDKAQAARIRKLKKFPSEEEWEPKTRKLSLCERLLLCGPQSSTTIAKQVEVYIPISNRWITYASTKTPQTVGRICSSIVQLHQPEEIHQTSLQFGCITQLFTHSFSDVTTVFAVVTLFSDANIDIELDMWFVPMKLTTVSVLVTVDEVSEPFVTAYDNNIIWLPNV